MINLDLNQKIRLISCASNIVQFPPNTNLNKDEKADIIILIRTANSLLLPPFHLHLPQLQISLEVLEDLFSLRTRAVSRWSKHDLEQVFLVLELRLKLRLALVGKNDVTASRLSGSAPSLNKSTKNI